MKTEYGFDLPRRLQIEFFARIQHIAEDPARDNPSGDVGHIPGCVSRQYRNTNSPATSSAAFHLGDRILITAQIDVDGKRHTIIGEGNDQ